MASADLVDLARREYGDLIDAISVPPLTVASRHGHRMTPPRPRSLVRVSESRPLIDFFVEGNQVNKKLIAAGIVGLALVGVIVVASSSPASVLARARSLNAIMATDVKMISLTTAGFMFCCGLGYAAFAYCSNAVARIHFRREHDAMESKQLPGGRRPGVGVAAMCLAAAIVLVFVAPSHMAGPALRPF